MKEILSLLLIFALLAIAFVGFGQSQAGERITSIDDCKTYDCAFEAREREYKAHLKAKGIFYKLGYTD